MTYIRLLEKDILEKLKAEEDRVRKILIADADDLEELKSEWQERDSPAERNLREVEWSQFSALQDELVAIEDARRRLEAGKYGDCEDCGRKISPKRLEAVPTAAKCLGCQERGENESGLSGNRATL